MEHNTGVGLGEFEDIMQKQNKDGSHAIIGEPLTKLCRQNERNGSRVGNFSVGRHGQRLKSLSMSRIGPRLTTLVQFTTYYLFVIFLVCCLIRNMRIHNIENENDYEHY